MNVILLSSRNQARNLFRAGQKSKWSHLLIVGMRAVPIELPCYHNRVISKIDDREFREVHTHKKKTQKTAHQILHELNQGARA